MADLSPPFFFLNHLNRFSSLVVRFYATCGRRGWLNRVVTHCSRPWLIVAQSAPCWAPLMVQQAGVAHRFSYHGINPTYNRGNLNYAQTAGDLSCHSPVGDAPTGLVGV